MAGLPDRIGAVEAFNPEGGLQMAEMNPLRRRMIEDMQSQPVAGDAALLRARGRQIRPAFQPAT